MTEFFKSAQVRAALAELAEIQDDLAHTMSNPRILSDDEKKDYVKKLKLFLEKQKLFFFRVSLSDDPEAVQVKEHILDTAQMFGFKEMTGMDKFFQQLDETIKKVENIIKNLEFKFSIKSTTITINKAEGDIAEKLSKIASQYPNVSIGSYPFENGLIKGTNIVISHYNEELIKEIAKITEKLK